MQIEDVKVGQKVEVLAENLFYHWNIGKIGLVKEIEDEYITVLFEDENDDYGYATGLKLIEDVASAPANVKAAIADVEKALAALKVLVG